MRTPREVLEAYTDTAPDSPKNDNAPPVPFRQ